MEGNQRYIIKGSILLVIFFLHFSSQNVEARRRYRMPPRPMVKVGNDILSLTRKTHGWNTKKTETVDIAPLLGINDNRQSIRSGSSLNSHYLRSSNKYVAQPKMDHSQRVYILRRKQPTTVNNFKSFRHGLPLNQQVHYLNTPQLYSMSSVASSPLEHNNRRSYSTMYSSPLANSSKAKLQWLAMQSALQRSRAINSLGLSSQIEENRVPYDSLLPLLYQYKMQKQAIAHAKYLQTLQLLALATSQDPLYSYSPEMDIFTQSFLNSPYSSLLRNASFIPANYVDNNKSSSSSSSTTTSTAKPTNNNDQVAAASGTANERSASEKGEYTSLNREIEKQKRKLLEVFPPPESEVPFGERTILMVRFPPVPHQKKKKGVIKLKSAYDIDGGITFGGPRWKSFGTPFNPWDHPWNKPKHAVKQEPTHYVVTEADKPSSYGVIITQKYIYRPSIKFTNSDPKWLAKNQGDILHGGPSIVAQLAKALAEGNRISNSYFLSKANLHGKQWSSSERKPPFVIVHLDTYTKKSNDSSGAWGVDEQVEANYANGTIIYPTFNDPHILASTKFEFHDGNALDKIFDKPLETHGHGWGWGASVPVLPKGIKEIRNFLKLMHKVHMEAHAGGKKKVEDLRKLGDKLDRPAFPDSKPLLRNQIADRSTTWLHTSSVGIRSLSEDDDHFPYEKHPTVDISNDYEHYK